MAKFTISKEFHFCASHELTHLVEEQPDHKCARLHGHNYVVRVFITGEELNMDSFVLDYGELKWFGDLIDEKFDHRCLNNSNPNPPERNKPVFEYSVDTTAENLAKYFHGVVTSWIDSHPMSYADYIRCSAVEVQETPKTCSRYEG